MDCIFVTFFYNFMAVYTESESKEVIGMGKHLDKNIDL